MATTPLTPRQVAARKAARTRDKNAQAKRQADLNAEADRVYALIRKKTPLTFNSDTRKWTWSNGNVVDVAVVNLLERQKRARIGDHEKLGRRLYATTPEQVDAERKQQDAASEQRKTARLDRWMKLIYATSNREECHKVLEQIAGEAMALGTLGD